MSDQMVKFNDDGTVTCTVAGKRHRLRRPNMGELRRLRELSTAVDDDVSAVLDPHRERFAELRADIARLEVAAESGDATPGELSELRREQQHLNNKLLPEMEAIRAAWIRDVFTTLADPPLEASTTDDPSDGLEPWMVEPTIAGLLQVHWKAVPLDRGAPQNLGMI